MIKIGDTVARKSYELDLMFKVTDIQEGIAILHGKTVRLIADAPLEDLEIVSDDDIRRAEEEEDQIIENIQLTNNSDKRQKFITGKILHFDGDEHYMNKCLDLYKKLDIYAVGVSVDEDQLPKVVTKYIDFFNPDIVIITGHDSFNKKEIENVGNYRNSQYFIDATKAIRKKYSVINQPIIIAGACQSHFEALIAAGSNFASSPNRVNIKSLDPAIIAIKCAVTPINDFIKVTDAINKTSSKNSGLGGIESFGTMKKLYY